MAVELAREDAGLRRHRAEVRLPLRVDLDRAEPAGRRHAAVGRAGRLLLRRHAACPTARRSRSRCARSSACCRSARPPCSTPTCSSASRRSSSASRAFIEHFADAVPSLAHLPGPSPEGRRLLALSTRRSCGRSWRSCSTRTSSSGRTGSARSRGATSTHPYRFDWGGQSYEVRYLPAESDTGMFGGNSNWRGPVWFPMNLVILRGLIQLHRYYGDRAQGRVPDRLGARARPARGRRGDRRPADAHVPRGRAGAPARVRRHREVPDRPALARPAAVPRVLPRRQRRRPRRQPSDRLDRDRGAAVPARRVAAAGSRCRPPASPPMRLPPRPTVYEINTAVWLERLGRARGRPLTLGEVADGEWDALAALPVDAVWLMGVWQRSPAGLRIALADPALDARQSRRAARPARGGRDRLALLRARLRGRRALRRPGRPRTRARAARRAAAWA